MGDWILAVVSPSIRPFACSTRQSLTNVRSGHGIFENPIPLRKDEVGSDHHTAALAAIGQHCETYSGFGCPCQFFSGTHIYWLLLYIKNQSESILWDIITEESPKTTFFTIKTCLPNPPYQAEVLKARWGCSNFKLIGFLPKSRNWMVELHL